MQSIDLMRGLVMVLMALDHTRDFFSNALFSPTDLEQTSVGLFLTRWITHFCAPTFVFLAGVSAFLSAARNHLSERQLAWYLITRGCWLIVLELTLVRFGWTFNWQIESAIAQVIWVLGWSMIVLAGLVFVPRVWVALFAVLTIAGHNGFDYIRPDDLAGYGWLWTFLHVRGVIEYWPNHFIFVIYPLLPWAAVMAAGYCLAPLFLQTAELRKRRLKALSLALIGGFFILRGFNLYGDPEPWGQQKNVLFTLFAILNCQKYPPSLLYLLMTLGPMLMTLVWLEGCRLQYWFSPLLVFGQVPLFFYLLHLLVIHGAAVCLALLRGFPVDWLFHGSERFPFVTMPKSEYAYDLSSVYVVWVIVLCALYPLCSVYSRFKQKHPHYRWLAYL
jgi:uncharacterized membrane protein